MIWTALELIFLFFFFELPTVDDFVKSKYEEYLEYSQQVQNAIATDNKQNDVDKKYDKGNQNNVEEQNSSCDPSLSEQEKMPLLPSDSTMKDIQASATNCVNTTSSQSLLRRAQWLLNG